MKDIWSFQRFSMSIPGGFKTVLNTRVLPEICTSLAFNF